MYNNSDNNDIINSSNTAIDNNSNSYSNSNDNDNNMNINNNIGEGLGGVLLLMKNNMITIIT